MQLLELSFVLAVVKLAMKMCHFFPLGTILSCIFETANYTCDVCWFLVQFLP